MKFGEHVLISSTPHVYRLFLPFTCNYITIKGHSDASVIGTVCLEDSWRTTIVWLEQLSRRHRPPSLTLGKRKLAQELDQQSMQWQWQWQRHWQLVQLKVKRIWQRITDTSGGGLRCSHGAQPHSIRTLRFEFHSSIFTLRDLLTFASFAIGLKGEAHRAAASDPCGRVLTRPVAATVVNSAGLCTEGQRQTEKSRG